MSLETTLKQIKVICNEINRNATNNELVIRINTDADTFEQDYEFCLSFDEEADAECVESTKNITVLNEVLRNMLNMGFVVSFETNYF